MKYQLPLTKLLFFPQTVDIEVHPYPACGLKPGIEKRGCGWLHVKSPKPQM